MYYCISDLIAKMIIIFVIDIHVNNILDDFSTE